MIRSRWWQWAVWSARSRVNRWGDEGFGFDPVMFIPALGKTLAQVTPSTRPAQPPRPVLAQDAGTAARILAVRQPLKLDEQHLLRS